jgi:hypothetical protein
MNGHPKKAKKERRSIRPWTYARAQAALPYVRSIMQSLRDYRLEAQSQHLRAQRLAECPGRPDRAALIAREEALRAAVREQDRFDDALHELGRVDVYCIDALAGVAFLPFVHEDQLAWYVFDLFSDTMLDAWRYHEDPLEMRRPIAEVAGQSPTAVSVA